MLFNISRIYDLLKINFDGNSPIVTLLRNYDILRSKKS